MFKINNSSFNPILLMLGFLSGITIFSFSSCATVNYYYRGRWTEKIEILTQKPKESFPPASFIVMNDLHLFSTELGTDGPAFQQYIEDDRKLIEESELILKAALQQVIEKDPDFLMIPGDLAKDGELYNHTLLAEYLNQVEEHGIEVYVIPGNHDILNPHAHSYHEEGFSPIETVTPQDFRRIYSRFGYEEALFTDPSSLSYVAEPVPGLWLLALDSCIYDKNLKKGKPETDGRFEQLRIDWIEEVLLTALRENKTVIAMQHHGALEHYPGQQKFYGEYIIEDYSRIAEMFATYNVNVVFTGHYHAQDITLNKREGEREKFLYDIETGSLVTWPCPYRHVELTEEGLLMIRSYNIEEIEGFPRGDETFSQYAHRYLLEGIAGVAVNTMEKLGVKTEEAKRISPKVAEAFAAHYRGDENFEGDTMLPTEGLSLMGSIVVCNRKDLIFGLWQDKPPVDNNIIINLRNGEWKPLEEPVASLR